MTNTFESFWLFVYLVGNHVVTLLAGCVVTVMLGLIEKYVLKRQLSLKWEIAILAVFVFFACFQTWRDEHHSLLLLQSRIETPLFGGDLGFVGIAKHTMGKYRIPMVFVAGIISHPQGPPSGLIGWKMGIKNPASGITWGKMIPLSERNQRGHVGSGFPGLVFKNEQYWPDCTAAPIATGGSVPGWFWSSFTQAEIDEGCKNHYHLVVQFKDVISGTTHEIEKDMPAPGIHADFIGP